MKALPILGLLIAGCAPSAEGSTLRVVSTAPADVVAPDQPDHREAKLQARRPTGESERKSTEISDEKPRGPALVPLRAGKPPQVVRKCAPNVRQRAPLTPVWTKDERGKPARPVSVGVRVLPDSTVVQLTHDGYLFASSDGGKSWTRTFTPEEHGSPDQLEMDGEGRLWAIGGWSIWHSIDGHNWTELTISEPGSEDVLGPGYITGGQLWVAASGNKILRRVSLEKGVPEWSSLDVLPAYAGGDVIFSLNGGFATVKYPKGGNYVFNAISGEHVPGGELDPRISPFPLGDRETMLELSKWFVANCYVGHLGPVAKIIENTDRFYTHGGAAFDGTWSVMTLTVSADNHRYHPASLVSGPTGVHLIPAGYVGVWMRRPGEFWFLGPGIVPVSIVSK